MEGTDWEESAEKSAEWSGEETEGSATDEEDETAGAARGVSKTRTEMAQVSKGNGAGKLSGSLASDKGDTWVVTSEDVDETGSGGRHGAKPRERERVSVRQENLAGKSSGVGGSEGVYEASGVAENPRGDCQGVRGGVKYPMGIGPHVVEELPWGDETSGVTPEGDRVPGEDRQGQGGDGTPPTTRETKASRDSSGDKEMTSGAGPAAPAAPPRSRRGMAAGRESAVRPHMHPDGANSARSERVSQYGLLALVEPAGDPAATEIQKLRDGHESTMGTGGLGREGDGDRGPDQPARAPSVRHSGGH